MDVDEMIYEDLFHIEFVKENLKRFAISDQEKQKKLDEQTKGMLDKYRDIQGIESNKNYINLIKQMKI